MYSSLNLFTFIMDDGIIILNNPDEQGKNYATAMLNAVVFQKRDIRLFLIFIENNLNRWQRGYCP